MQMIVLLDTNVILDYLLDRDGKEDVEAIFSLAKRSEDIDCITSSMITDIHYITKRNSVYDSFEIQDLLAELLKFVEVLEVTSEDIQSALSLRWNDFEDAVQYSVALANGIDCLVTRNKGDYIRAEIEVLTPKEFLEKYRI